MTMKNQKTTQKAKTQNKKTTGAKKPEIIKLSEELETFLSQNPRYENLRNMPDILSQLVGDLTEKEIKIGQLNKTISENEKAISELENNTISNQNSSSNGNYGSCVRYLKELYTEMKKEESENLFVLDNQIIVTNLMYFYKESDYSFSFNQVVQRPQKNMVWNYGSVGAYFLQHGLSVIPQTTGKTVTITDPKTGKEYKEIAEYVVTISVIGLNDLKKKFQKNSEKAFNPKSAKAGLVFEESELYKELKKDSGIYKSISLSELFDLIARKYNWIEDNKEDSDKPENSQKTGSDK